MCECICVFRCVYVCVWRPEDDIRFLPHCPPYFGLRSLTSEADKLSSQPQHPPLSSPQCGLTISSGCAGFWHEFWGGSVPRASFLHSKSFTAWRNVYDACMWVCMVNACECVWCIHVIVYSECMSVYDACMWVCLVHACQCVWFVHMSVHSECMSVCDACMWVCVVHACELHSECLWVCVACMWVCLVHACECFWCMYACEHAWCMHVNVQICICTCGGPRKLLNVFLYSLCLVGLEQSLTHQTLTSQRTPSILLSLPFNTGGAAHELSLALCWCWGFELSSPCLFNWATCTVLWLSLWLAPHIQIEREEHVLVFVIPLLLSFPLFLHQTETGLLKDFM